jgi:hypothetical protein
LSSQWNHQQLPLLLLLLLLLRRIYELYSDFVMKNPFYEVEQVSSCALYGAWTSCI